MSFDQVPHTTTIRVNDVEYQAFGNGNANKGLLTTQVEHDFKFDPVILAPFFIVGYPTYSEYKAGATDLFKPSTLKGGYKYQRCYSFSNGAKFNSYHNISFSKETGLQGVFSTRDFPAEAFKGKWEIADLVETFLPNGPGTIKSVMGVEWMGEGGKSLHAVIESEYFLNHNITLPCVHWRHVTFATQHESPNVYVQSEKITVVNNLDYGRPQNMLAALKDTKQNVSTTKTGAMHNGKDQYMKAGQGHFASPGLTT